MSSKDENKKDETDCQQQAHHNEGDERDAGHARQVPGKVHEIVMSAPLVLTICPIGPASRSG